MDLKLRFSFLFSLVLAAGLGIFSFLVFRQFQTSVLAVAETKLSAQLDHDWHHLQIGATKFGTLELPNIYIRAWRDEKLLFDSFPRKTEVSSVHGVERVGNKLIQQFEGAVHGHTYRLVGFYDLTSSISYLDALRQVLVLGCFLGFLLSLPISWVLAKWLLKPFRTFCSETSQMDAGRLSIRFPEAKVADEYGMLVKSFNGLLDRLERSFEQAKRFAQNASHELKTPLTVIRGEAEVMLRRTRTLEEYESVLRKILTQVEILTDVTSQLLFLADLEREKHEPLEPIHIGETLEQVIGSLRSAHQYGSVAISVQPVTGSLTFLGKKELFFSIAKNLIENAFKYAKGEVRVTWGDENGRIRIQVEDDGPGISVGQREFVLEPFTKRSMTVDRSEKKGHGLGLSIVKSCVDALHGTLNLGDSNLGGLSVTVTLPARV